MAHACGWTLWRPFSFDHSFRPICGNLELNFREENFERLRIIFKQVSHLLLMLNEIGGKYAVDLAIKFRT